MTTAASKLEDITASVTMFDLEYKSMKKEHMLTSEKDDEPVEVGPYLGMFSTKLCCVDI